MVITKEKSLILKGVAINFMILLHLFAFPERIESEKIEKIFDIFGYGLEYYIGQFSSICVGIYLLLSGYGLNKKYENKKIELKEILKRIINFYKEYWKIFIIFISLGYYLKVYNFNYKIFILNFFSISNSYNGEWWFIKYYILFILTFYFINKYSIKRIMLYSFFLFIFHFTSVFYKIEGIEVIYRYCYWQFYFILGIELSKSKYELKVENNTIIKTLIMVLFLGYSIIIYIDKYEILFQPLVTLIFVVLFIKLDLNSIIKKYLELMGKHSTNIWLFHSFFCYYYFKKYVYYFKNPIIIFVIFVFFNLAISFIINKIYLNIELLIFKKEEKDRR